MAELGLALLRTLILLLVSAVLPPDPNDPPSPPEGASGEAFESLGCKCVDTLPTGYSCDALPAFQDNEWRHENAEQFAIRAADFAGRVETALEDLKGKYYLALQGWADKREITAGKHKRWSQASRHCRIGHDPDEMVSNRDLAFLRACELRRMIREPLARQIELLPPIDFTDPKARIDPEKTYQGNNYKTTVLFIAFEDRRVCRNGK